MDEKASEHTKVTTTGSSTGEHSNGPPMKRIKVKNGSPTDDESNEPPTKKAKVEAPLQSSQIYVSMCTSTLNDNVWSVYLYIVTNTEEQKSKLKKNVEEKNLFENTFSVGFISKNTKKMTMNISLQPGETENGWYLPAGASSEIFIFRESIDTLQPASFKVGLKKGKISPFLHSYTLEGEDLRMQNNLCVDLNVLKQSSGEPQNIDRSKLTFQIRQVKGGMREEESSEDLPFRTNDYSDIKDPKTPLDNVDYEPFYRRVLFLFSVVNDQELKAALVAITAPDIENDENDLITRIQPGAYIGMIGKHPVGLIKHKEGNHCKKPLEEGIKLFPNVKYLVAVGVCYGFNREVTSFGDVLISKQIIDLGPFKVCEGTIDVRGDHSKMKDKIHNIFCLIPDQVIGMQVASGGRKARHFAGTLVSGNILVNHQAFREKINYATTPEAYGGEMEGGSLLELQKDGVGSGGTNQHTEVIVIKAVVDYADGTKEIKWQFIAAQAAFHYATEKIKLCPVSPEEKAPLSVLTISDQNDIIMWTKHLNMETMKNLGKFLGLTVEVLSQMETPDDVIKKWMKTAKPPRLSTLVSSLNKVGQTDLANVLRQKYKYLG